MLEMFVILNKKQIYFVEVAFFAHPLGTWTITWHLLCDSDPNTVLRKRNVTLRNGKK